MYYYNWQGHLSRGEMVCLEICLLYYMASSMCGSEQVRWIEVWWPPWLWSNPWNVIYLESDTMKLPHLGSFKPEKN